ncbi:MAG: hypothetical protein L3J04_04350 [Robiginitomaculum sp.]|nr:hypothetical protein [Robiginitomaculum sp.]
MIYHILKISMFWLILSILLIGCTTQSLVTSKFYKPEENVVYRYGNFCGAYHPKRLNGADNIAFFQQLKSTKPIDDIDRACQAHDICYVTTKMDWSTCDSLLQRSLNPYDYAVVDDRLNLITYPQSPPKPTGTEVIVTAFEKIKGSENSHYKCANLAKEISYAFSFKYKQADKISSVANVISTPLSVGWGLEKLVGSVSYGFPEQAGGCFFSNATKNFVEKNAVMGFFSDIEKTVTSKRQCVRQHHQVYKTISCQAKFALGSNVTKTRADGLYVEFIRKFFPQSSYDQSIKN